MRARSKAASAAAVLLTLLASAFAVDRESVNATRPMADITTELSWFPLPSAGKLASCTAPGAGGAAPLLPIGTLRWPDLRAGDALIVPGLRAAQPASTWAKNYVFTGDVLKSVDLGATWQCVPATITNASSWKGSPFVSAGQAFMRSGAAYATHVGPGRCQLSCIFGGNVWNGTLSSGGPFILTSDVLCTSDGGLTWAYHEPLPWRVEGVTAVNFMGGLWVFGGMQMEPGTGNFAPIQDPTGYAASFDFKTCRIKGWLPRGNVIGNAMKAYMAAEEVLSVNTGKATIFMAGGLIRTGGNSWVQSFALTAVTYDPELSQVTVTLTTPALPSPPIHWGGLLPDQRRGLYTLLQGPEAGTADGTLLSTFTLLWQAGDRVWYSNDGGYAWVPLPVRTWPAPSALLSSMPSYVSHMTTLTGVDGLDYMVSFAYPASVVELAPLSPPMPFMPAAPGRQPVGPVPLAAGQGLLRPDYTGAAGASASSPAALSDVSLPGTSSSSGGSSRGGRRVTSDEGASSVSPVLAPPDGAGGDTSGDGKGGTGTQDGLGDIEPLPLDDDHDDPIPGGPPNGGRNPGTPPGGGGGSGPALAVNATVIRSTVAYCRDPCSLSSDDESGGPDVYSTGCIALPTDAVCRPCTTCGVGGKEAVPCGGQSGYENADRVCAPETVVLLLSVSPLGVKAVWTTVVIGPAIAALVWLAAATGLHITLLATPTVSGLAKTCDRCRRHKKKRLGMSVGGAASGSGMLGMEEWGVTGAGTSVDASGPTPSKAATAVAKDKGSKEGHQRAISWLSEAPWKVHGIIQTALLVLAAAIAGAGVAVQACAGVMLIVSSSVSMDEQAAGWAGPQQQQAQQQQVKSQPVGIDDPATGALSRIARGVGLVPVYIGVVLLAITLMQPVIGYIVAGTAVMAQGGTGGGGKSGGGVGAAAAQHGRSGSSGGEDPAGPDARAVVGSTPSSRSTCAERLNSLSPRLVLLWSLLHGKAMPPELQLRLAAAGVLLNDLPVLAVMAMPWYIGAANASLRDTCLLVIATAAAGACISAAVLLWHAWPWVWSYLGPVTASSTARAGVGAVYTSSTTARATATNSSSGTGPGIGGTGGTGAGVTVFASPVQGFVAGSQQHQQAAPGLSMVPGQAIAVSGTAAVNPLAAVQSSPALAAATAVAAAGQQHHQPQQRLAVYGLQSSSRGEDSSDASGSSASSEDEEGSREQGRAGMGGAAGGGDYGYGRFHGLPPPFAHPGGHLLAGHAGQVYTNPYPAVAPHALPQPPVQGQALGQEGLLLLHPNPNPNRQGQALGQEGLLLLHAPQQQQLLDRVLVTSAEERVPGLLSEPPSHAASVQGLGHSHPQASPAGPAGGYAFLPLPALPQ